MMLSGSFSFITQARNVYKTTCLNMRLNHNYSSHTALSSGVTHLHQILTKKSITLKHRGLSLAVASAHGAEGSGLREEEHSALETVLKLYTAIKNRNLNQLSDIIGEECRCTSNLVSTFQPFLGKKQVLDFFSCLMRYLGNNIELVVQPTLDDGMCVGISWSLNCKKTGAPLGKGFSFHSCNKYHGKLVIRNVEMFMEPLLHIEPLRLKLIAVMINVINKMGSLAVSHKTAKRARSIVLTLLFLAALMFLLSLASSI